MKAKRNIEIPKIGKRIIKTTIAVFLSIAIYIVLLIITEKLGMDRTDLNSPTIIYTPFFAAIAATYALHRDNKTSLAQAKIRSFGSVVGGYFGMFVILITDFFLIDIFNLYETNFVLYTLITYIVVALAIIPLIWLTVVIKQKTATFITCLTYFSVTISIRNGGLPVFLFATNRVLSTLVGVGIALAVNNINLIRNKNKKILFVSSLDNNLLTPASNQMSPYIKYKINNLYFKDMPLTFMTTRTMSTLDEMFKDVEVSFPIVVMNGVAIYNFNDKTYDEVFKLGPNSRKLVEAKLQELNINYFTYSIDDNMLHCFYDKITNDGQKRYYEMCRKSHFDNFVRAKLPEDSSSSLYIIIEKKSTVEALSQTLSNSDLSSRIDVVTYPFDESEKFYYLKINSKAAKKENLIKVIKTNMGFEKVVVCGSGKTDLPVIELADYSIALQTSPEYVKEKVDLVLGNNPEEILKVFEKIYYTRNVEKTINRLNKKYQKIK